MSASSSFSSQKLLLFTIIALEGYIVLATELLAIRQLIPFVGSGTEVVSIVISAVLLPLAVGYHVGGRRYEIESATARQRGKSYPSIRAILLKNLLTSLIILSIGTIYISMELFFTSLSLLGITHRIAQAALYSIVFLVYPTFLLAQTVPLVSNYFSQARLSEITGKMLFFSTTGSFFGSVISTIVLMSVIGVHNTVNFTLSLIALLIFMTAKRWYMYDNFLAILLVAMAWGVNGKASLDSFDIVADTPYSLIAVKTPEGEPDNKVMYINRSTSSKYAANPKERFEYLRYFEKNFIEPIATGNAPPKQILILGAGGFTTGWDDHHNHYVFVDIDEKLKEVSEQRLLPTPLPANKTFVATSARAFLHREQDKKYDLVHIDVFSNIHSIPLETTTREFLLDVKRVLKDDGILVANIISSPNFQDKFTVRYRNTFASVFPTFDRQIIGDFNAWDMSKEPQSNTLYVYYNHSLAQDRELYTDDHNTYTFDR